MKKLSKAQQQVVDMMRDGWYYCVIGNDSPQLIVLRLAYTKTISAHKGIFNALLKASVIEKGGYDGFTTVYYLSKEYKTDPAGKQG